MKRGSTLIILGLLLAASGCSRPEPRPNVLWVVWDTVRADRLSLYGHDRPTTPFLERWSAGARVFEDCVSTAGSTVPSHAAMFTGLLPTEHGAFFTNQTLQQEHATIAERLNDAGYRTYLFAANPHIQASRDFTQGFETHEHPWSERWREDALRIVRSKIAPEDRSSTLPDRLRAGIVGDWALKAAGDLARQGLLEWLDGTDPDRPFFAFLNYMEAHAPYIPPRELRERFLAEDDVERSYAIDSRSATRWAYTFGQHEYPPGDLDILGAVYDATLVELDALFERLLQDLEAAGHLDDTIVVLTADHGEHLSEHHMLDHQYALYQPLLHVPLVVHYPPRFAPGRDDSPVMNFDLFPTLLELCGLDPPEGSQALSLLDSRPDRGRLAEYPAVFEVGIRQVQKMRPDWNAQPWVRRMRAWYHERHKLVCATDGRHELFDLGEDPGEQRNLVESETDLGARLMGELLGRARSLQPPMTAETIELSDQEREMLTSLGYLGDDGGEDELGVDALEDASCGF